ncbi:hypothetical protein [Sphingobacterium thermophilum]|uniref:Uncharacterized protein n=1 Tax=Sphingobacterium thermophilum TaxID=768534 RepID=A0ABP8QZW5_9SPHI
MIQLMEGLNIDTTLLSFASFIYGLALIAIYKMHNIKKGLLFLLYISTSAFLIYLFITYSFVSSVLVLLYIGHLLYNNHMETHENIQDE